MRVGAILTDPSSAALEGAITENWWAYLRAFGRAPRVTLHETRVLRWFITGIPDPVFNGVMHTDLAPATVDRTIQMVRQAFAMHQAPLSWLVFPASRPDDLAAHLEAHGLRRTVQVRTASALLTPAESARTSRTPELTIARVADADAWRAWTAVEPVGFEITAAVAGALSRIRQEIGYGGKRAGEHHLLGMWRGEPVATATLILAAGIAGIYDVSTLPAARRQGIGAALTRAAMDQAYAAGYRVAVLQPSAMGMGMYSRLGFRPVLTADVYA